MSEDVRPPAPQAEQRQPPPGDRTFGGEFLRNIWTSNTVTVTVLAFVLALVIGAILIIASTPEVLSTFSYFFARPSDALAASWDKVSTAYVEMFKGSIFNWDALTAWTGGTGRWQDVFYPLSETLSYATPLVFTGLSVALAFRAGMFNIGAQGQVLLGATGAVLLGFSLHLPVGLHLFVALLGGAIGGLIWGFIPGFLKARTGAHEVITTIMLNYIAMYFLNWLIDQRFAHSPTRLDPISKDVLPNAKLPLLLGGGLRLDSGTILAVLAVIAVAWLLKRSTFGFELRAVGSNPAAARTAGMSVAATIVIVMALAGALAGLGGTAVVLGAQANSLTPSVATNVGFTGISVALLGRVRPWGVFLAALLFGAITAGGNRMQSFTGISLELTQVLQAVIVAFVAAPALVKAIFALRPAGAARLGTSVTKGW